MTEVRTRARDYIIEEEDDACKRKRLKAAKVSLVRKQIQDKEASNVLKVKEVGQLIKEFKGKPLYSRKDSMERKHSRQATNFRRRKRPKGNTGDESAKSLLEAKVAETGEDGEYGIDPWHDVKGRSKWCEYHNLGGHKTSNCLSLKGQVRQLIRARQPRVAGHGLDKDSMKRAPNAVKTHSLSQRKRQYSAEKPVKTHSHLHLPKFISPSHHSTLNPATCEAATSTPTPTTCNLTLTPKHQPAATSPSPTCNLTLPQIPTRCNLTLTHLQPHLHPQTPTCNLTLTLTRTLQISPSPAALNPNTHPPATSPSLTPPPPTPQPATCNLTPSPQPETQPPSRKREREKEEI
ncbi:extensin-like [Lotus japonicus]|uniref:extensin-like n=1 Tax=Lotus japonicus TaxID=34305 RepID=UPI00258F2C32|nr:extensin-like [Lotus japonicus]